jgi:hypothetical protein
MNSYFERVAGESSRTRPMSFTLLKATPRFMTNRTFLSVRMSRSGWPSMAMMSAQAARSDDAGPVRPVQELGRAEYMSPALML